MRNKDFLTNLDKQLKSFATLLVDELNNAKKSGELTAREHKELSAKIYSWLWMYVKMTELYQCYVQKIPVHFEIFPGIPHRKEKGKNNG